MLNMSNPKRKDTSRISLDENGRKFKRLTETYKMNTFLLTMGLMYPNPRYDGKRKIWIAILIVSVLPALMTVCEDMRRRVLRDDMPNFVRQSIIMVSLVFVVTKLILTVVRREELKDIFDGIDEDYEKFNNLPEDYHQLIVQTIKKTKTLEKIWISIMAVTASSYPVLAGVCTVYSQIFSENPRRFMVHETAIIFLTEEQKYQSPCYELFAVYSIYIVWIVFIGFTGYDGMFSVCIMHVSLKIKIFNQNLIHLLDDKEDILKIKRKIAEFVRDHCEVIRLISQVQKCFEVWLVGIFFNAVLQIGMALSQITAKTAGEIANTAYSCSWESIQNVDVRKSICMIINRAQIPIHFRALDMLTFNMEMFVSILQTAYSMYTLLRS